MTDGLKPKHRAAIVAALAAHEKVDRAVLFGSRAMQTHRASSDVDIALFGEGLTWTDLAELSAAMDDVPMAQSVDLVLHRSIDNPALLKHIREHGVEWYRRRGGFNGTREIEGEHVVIVHKKKRDGPGKWLETVYGRFLADLSQDSLVNLCDINDGIQTGPFGSQLHQKDYVSTGTPIVTVEHLGENRLSHHNLPRVSESDRERLSKYTLRKGDIVFSRVGSVDRRALVRRAEEGWLFSGRCLRVRPDPVQIDSGYLSYFFGLPMFQAHIKSIAVGATMPSLNTQILSDITVLYPSLPEQRAIAHVLGTLDDKIELNRRMNETLESMARALFKSWFIDFDPVRAKMALKQQTAQAITPPLRGSRQGKGASPPARRWGEIKRQYTQQTLQRSQTLRESRTDAEGLLWHYLRNKQLGGYKFRRQQPIGPYIVDFACLPQKLLIELDGGQHAEQHPYDQKRDAFLRAKGYNILRFWNNEVFENCFGMLERIYEMLSASLPTHAPENHSPLEGES